MAKILITRRLSAEISEEIRQWAKLSGHQLQWWEQSAPMPSEELAAALKNVQGVLCTLSDQLGEGLLSVGHSPQLKVISTMSVGYNHLHLPSIKKRNIILGYTPDVLTEACADFAVGLMLALSRRIAEGDRAVRLGNWPAWQPDFMLGSSLRGKTIGILGAGRIGKEVGRVAREALRMEVKELARGHDLYLELGQCDVVTCHLPLNSMTAKIIDSKFLKAMKKASFLINTARGEMVDQEALIEVLASGHLAGAGLDVADPEPLALDHPLLKYPNVLITPHIASAEIQTREKMARMAFSHLRAGLEGGALLSPKL